MAPVAALILAGALAAAAVVQPLWPAHLVASLLWFGGAWRALAVPLAAAALAGAAAANTLAPGVLWRGLRAAAQRLRRWGPGLAALVVGLAATGLSAGLLAVAGAARAAGLLLVQMALFPGMPFVALAFALVTALAAADRGGVRALPALRGAWRARPRTLEQRAAAAFAALAAALGGGLLAAALFPAAMQGWGRAEAPDAQRYNFYSSFFNYAISDDRIVQREGFELGEHGLTLPPGGQGAIAFRLERPPESLVFLKADFYNRRFRRPGEAAAEVEPATFPNAIELSLDQGHSYRAVLEDTSIGAVVGGAVLDLTPFVGDARSYLLRFRAANTTAEEKTVLASLVVSTVADPLALPDPAFPIVAYLAAGAGVAYVVGRAAGRTPGAALLAALAFAAVATVVASAAQALGPRLGAAGPRGIAGTADVPGAGAGLAYGVWAARGALAAALAAGVALWSMRRRTSPPDPPHQSDRGPATSDKGALPPDSRSDAQRRDAGRGDWDSADEGRDGRRSSVVGRLLGARPGLGRRSAVGGRLPWLALACLVVGLAALDARWMALMRVRAEFLLPDAQGYRAIAAEIPQKLERYQAQRESRLLDELYAAGFDGRASALAVFYAGGNQGREPLWPWALRLTFNVLGESAFHTRLTSIGYGTLVAALTCWLGWRALHPLVGLTAGALLALNPPHIVNSVAGLREELVGTVFLLLVAALFVGARRGAAPWRRVGAAGMAAAALVLIRADMLVLAGLVVTLGALARRWPWRRLAATLGVMAALAGPMYAGYAFTHGDPFYPGTYGATVNRNLEFPERMGTPGFPSPEAYAANWAAGPPSSPMQYFFGYHTLPQVVAYSVRGFVRIFRDILFEGQPLVLWLCVAGMALLLATRRWLVPFAAFISLAPFYAFLAGVPSAWVFAPRYAHHALPYATLAAAYALWFVPLALGTTWRRHWRWPRQGAAPPAA